MTIEAIFQTVVSFIQTNGYFLLLLGMIVEGPAVTTTFSFAASLGYFNIFIVLLLSIIGDVLGDFIHFATGKYFGKKGSIFKKKLKLNYKRLAFIEKNIKKHTVKTLLILKMIPPMTSIGLIFVGSSKMKMPKLILSSFLATLPMSIFYVCLGYFFGAVSKSILDYLKMGQYAAFFLIVFVIIAYFLVKRISKKTEKIGEKFIK